MLGMNQREGRIFRVALLCHIAFAFCLFIYGFIPSCEEEPEVVHVFELASSPPPHPLKFAPPHPSQLPSLSYKNLCPNQLHPSLSRWLKSQHQNPSQLQNQSSLSHLPKRFPLINSENSTTYPFPSQRLSNHLLGLLKLRSTPTISNSPPLP